MGATCFITITSHLVASRSCGARQYGVVEVAIHQLWSHLIAKGSLIGVVPDPVILRLASTWGPFY